MPTFVYDGRYVPFGIEEIVKKAGEYHEVEEQDCKVIQISYLF